MIFRTLISTFSAEKLMYRVLLSGAAGSGKGTIARMLVREFEPLGFNYFAAGDFIRDHIARGTGKH